jgi:hypothetical protein
MGFASGSNAAFGGTTIYRAMMKYTKQMMKMNTWPNACLAQYLHHGLMGAGMAAQNTGIDQ